MPLTLYDCATAPSPRRARIFLAEKGITELMALQQQALSK